eukprot:jgi/Botrbrau1/9688/Bobra.0201s0019.2
MHGHVTVSLRSVLSRHRRSCISRVLDGRHHNQSRRTRQCLASASSNLMHEYNQQLSAKIQGVEGLFSQVKLPTFEVFEGPAHHYRLRAEFRVWHDGPVTDYVMFRKREENGVMRHHRIPVHQLPLASLLVNELMEVVMEAMMGNPILRNKLFQANFHTTLSGESMVTLVYHKQLTEEWVEAAQKLRSVLGACPSSRVPLTTIVGRSFKQKLQLDTDYVTETLVVEGKQFRYRQVEGSFSQPNGIVCQHMLTWARDVTRGCTGDLVELYCGNGNFTVALADNFRKVLATEVSKAGTQAATHNLDMNGVANVQVARLTALAWRRERTFYRLEGIDLDDYDLQTILVDPPRGGLDDETIQLLKHFPNVVYISCNPQTLQANLNGLLDTYKIKRFAVFDQFPFTGHIECGVFLQKK